MTELCAAYGISRKTGYKWLARYETGGLPALLISRVVPRIHRPPRRPSSSRPSSSRPRPPPTLGPAQTAPSACASSCRRRPGPRAARSRSISSARGSCPRPVGCAGRGIAGRPQAAMDAPNAVWTMDFKGPVPPWRRLPRLSAHDRRRVQSDAAQLSARSPARRFARAARSSCAPFRHTGSPCESARTTASRSPPRRSAGSRPSRSGGCASASCPT